MCIMTILQSFADVLSSSFDGIDHTLAGQGGWKCYQFLTITERSVDTIAFILFAVIIVIPRVLRTLSLPPEPFNIEQRRPKHPCEEIIGVRKWLLIAICMVFGAEMGFKFMERTWIYVLNVCHMITIVQIYLLSAQPSRTCTAVFRIHIHLLFAPFLAVLFPATNSRGSAAKLIVFWLQHILITFVIPTYLINIGGTYSCEAIKDFSWAMLTVLVIGFYMYFVVQGIGMLTLANLNTVLCPAPSDPFYGPYYRLFALVFTILLTLLYGKLYCVVLHAITRLKKTIMKVETKDNYFVDAVEESKGK